MMEVQRFARISAMTVAAGLVVFFLADWVIMPLYTHQGETTKVPDVIGLPVEEAKRQIEKAGLRAHEFEERADKQFPIGTVALQNPPAGAEVKFERGIYLTISGGEALTFAPALRGKSLREATFMLEKLGLKVGLVTYEPSEENFANTVIRQDVEAGKRVRGGSSVGLVVSQGSTAEKKIVPSVLQKSFTEAQKILTQSGFLVGKVTFVSNGDLLPNTVVAQSPNPGEYLMFGQTVDVTVTQKPETTPSFEN